jgi:hypothetical protein
MLGPVEHFVVGDQQMPDQLSLARHVVLNGHLYSATMIAFAWAVLVSARGSAVRQSRVGRAS